MFSHLDRVDRGIQTTYLQDSEEPVNIPIKVPAGQIVTEMTCEALLGGHVLPPFVVDVWAGNTTDWRLVSNHQKLALERRYSRILIKTLNVGVTPGLGRHLEELEEDHVSVDVKCLLGGIQ